MVNLVPKTPPATWLATARKALIEEGIHGVKVDRLAQRLGVTRGGFYKHFADRGALLERLLDLWEAQNVFALELPPLKTRQSARDALVRLTDRLIEEDGFDPRFDLAVRDWARTDKRAAWAVERVDAKRIDLLRRLFLAIGCDDEEAAMRARVFYYHQIGYYALGVKQTTAERKRMLPLYMRILVGTEHLGEPGLPSARAAAARTAPARAAGR
jgi:AcrR family transcriptional regulator